jgi:heptosyltransferase-2
MKLAIFLPNWIGDTCMAIPALRALQAGVSRHVRLVGIARPGPAALLQHQSLLDEVIIYQSRARGPTLNRRQLVARLRREKMETAVLLPNSFSSAVLAFLAGIPRRIGFARDSRSWLLTDRLHVPANRGRPIPIPAIDYYLKLAEYLGCPSVDRHMALKLRREDEELASLLWKRVGFSSKLPTVVINNNAATSPTRLWPEERVLHLAEKLVRHPEIQVLLHCGPRERGMAEQLVQRASHPRIQSMGILDELPLGLSFAVLAKAAAVVSTDSGARSLAVAMDRPVVSLFGPTKPEWTLTYNQPEIMLRPDETCPSCRKSPTSKNNAGRDCTCLQRISVDQVYLATLAQLNSQHRQRERLAA